MKKIGSRILGFAAILIVASLLLLLLLYYVTDAATAGALLLPLAIMATVCFAYGTSMLAWHDKLLLSHSKFLTLFNMVVSVSRLLLAAIGLGLYAVIVSDRSHLLPFTVCLLVYYFITVAVMTHHCIRTERQQTAITQ